MPAKRLLRVLILVQIPILLAIGAAAYLSGPSLSAPLQNLMNGDRNGPAATALGVGGALAFLVANICLFVFWSGAPALYLIVTVALQFASFGLGPFVTTGWIDLFETASTMLNGIILGLVYFSPAQELFKRREAAGKSSVPQTVAPPFAAVEMLAAASASGHAVLFCGACGARGSGGRFCPECGKPLVAAPTAVPGPSSGKWFARWPVMVAVVAVLVLSLVAVQAVMRNQNEKAAEKARQEKSNYEFEHRDFDPTKLLKGQPGAAQDHAASKSTQEEDANKGRDVFDRMFYERNCDAGDAEACGKAAVMYSEGRGATQDPVKALQLHRKACEGGRVASCEAVKNAAVRK
jgi:hypothetical protein